jgi:calmodulin
MRQRVNPEILNAAEIARLREDFNYFDRNNDGLMEFEEFVRFLSAIGADMSRADCEAGFNEIDTDHDGVIDFEEFCDWWGAP